MIGFLAILTASPAFMGVGMKPTTTHAVQTARIEPPKMWGGYGGYSMGGYGMGIGSGYGYGGYGGYGGYVRHVQPNSLIRALIPASNA